MHMYSLCVFKKNITIGVVGEKIASTKVDYVFGRGRRKAAFCVALII